MHDLRFAARTLVKRPGFAAVAAATLALGIGATTAVFSIVNGVLLRPLPYKDPRRLAAAWVTSTREKGLAKVFDTYADFLEYRRASRSFEAISAATWARNPGRVLTGMGSARDVLAIPATSSFFDTLGVTAVLGRTFRQDDERNGCSMVLAHRFWASAGGSEKTIIGRMLTLSETPCTVLGVMPENFSFYPSQTDAWVLAGPDFEREKDHALVGIFARLKPGVTLAQAQAELRSLYHALHTSAESRDFEPIVLDLQGEFTFLAGRTLRTTLMLVLGAVLLVLLIGCLNVANLVLARITDREREFAVRAALGSGQARLVRQVLTEGLLLSALGAVPGVAIAWAAVRYFRAVNPIELRVGSDVSLNLPVLAFSIALSIATALIFGLLPARRASRVDLTQRLRRAQRHGIARFAIAAETALSFVLLTGAGLLITSAFRMASEPLGFNPDRVLATHISLPAFRYPTNADRIRVYNRLIQELETLPGSTAVTFASRIPPDGGGSQALEMEGRPAARAAIHDVGAETVSSAFFSSLNIPVRRGRVFDARDSEGSLPVAIVNEALAHEYFPNADPIGQLIRITDAGSPWLTVVGVAGNLKHTELMNEMSWVESPILYRPLAQEPRGSMQIAVRCRGEMAPVAAEIRKRLSAFNAAVPVAEVEPLASRLSKILAYPRFRAMMLASFALGALLLSAVGLHGVLSQFVAQRTPELGVRRAVGAQNHHLVALIARQGGIPVLAGLAAGMAVTNFGSRVLASLLYGVRAADWRAALVVSLVLLATAAIAILAPAARAARLDPMAALREE